MKPEVETQMCASGVKARRENRRRATEFLDFIMQPLKVGITPIGRKYELRLAEIARRTLLYLLYLHTSLQ